MSARSGLVLRVRRQWPFHSALWLQQLRRVAVPGLAVQRLAAGQLGLVETLAGADAVGRYFVQFGVGSRFDGAPLLGERAPSSGISVSGAASSAVGPWPGMAASVRPASALLSPASCRDGTSPMGPMGLSVGASR